MHYDHNRGGYVRDRLPTFAESRNSVAHFPGGSAYISDPILRRASSLSEFRTAVVFWLLDRGKIGIGLVVLSRIFRPLGFLFFRLMIPAWVYLVTRWRILTRFDE